jgi:hypothetical protein
VRACVRRLALAAVAVIAALGLVAVKSSAKPDALAKQDAVSKHPAPKTRGEAQHLRERSAFQPPPAGFDKLALSQRFLSRGRTCPVTVAADPSRV